MSRPRRKRTLLRRREEAMLPKGARKWCAVPILGGASLIARSWGGAADAAVVGSVVVIVGAHVWALTLPSSTAAAPRVPIAARRDFGAWTPGRVFGAVLATTLIVVAPTLFAAAGRSSSALALAVAAIGVGLGGLRASIPPGDGAWFLRRRDAKRRADRPAEPWTWDGPWRADGETRPFARRLLDRRGALGAACAACFLLGLPAPATPAVTALRFALGVVGTLWAWRAWRAFGMGAMSVGFATFPIHPGGRAELTFGVSPGAPPVVGAVFVLRHFRERRDGDGGALCDATIAESGPPERRVFAPGVDQRVRFDVPPDAPGTSITSANPSYWELDVLGRMGEETFEERFLVPIYARPTAQRDDVSNAPSPDGTSSGHERSGLPGTTSTAE